MRRIRLATPIDGPELAAIYAPSVRDSHTSFELEAPTGDEMARRITATLQTHPWLVLEDTTSCVIEGYAYGTTHRTRAAYQWSCEVSVYVRQGLHRRGTGRTLYTELFALLARQGFYNAYAGITLPNPASIGLHESVGFKPVGVYTRIGFKHGEWHDVGWYERPLRELSTPTAPPAPLASIAGAIAELSAKTF